MGRKAGLAWVQAIPLDLVIQIIADVVLQARVPKMPLREHVPSLCESSQTTAMVMYLNVAQQLQV